MNSRSIVHSVLAQAAQGSLRITDPDGSTHFFGPGPEPGEPVAELLVQKQSFYRRLLLKSEIGLGDSYLEEEWTSPDLYETLRWFLLNHACWARSQTRWAQPLLSFLVRLGERIAHRRNRNTPGGSRRNIEAHYDLGNAFYEKFLDPSMAYSSGYFLDRSTSLPEAQVEKMDRICRQLALQPEDHVLEIGCGWGSQAIHMATKYHCRVTAITLSPSQRDYAVRRVADAGLSDRIEIRLVDYRHVQGQFDKIVSIEMLEAVGEKYLPRFFSECDRLLKPDGLMGVQSILGASKRYRHYRKNSDWIRKHIFPGSHLPTVSSLADAKSDDLDLELYHFESFGLHYARTLKIWLEHFEGSWPEIQELGFDDRFRLKWRYYLTSCAAAFAERHINVAQFVWGRTNCRSYRFEAKGDVPEMKESPTVPAAKDRQFA